MGFIDAIKQKLTKPLNYAEAVKQHLMHTGRFMLTDSEGNAIAEWDRGAARSMSPKPILIPNERKSK